VLHPLSRRPRREDTFGILHCLQQIIFRIGLGPAHIGRLCGTFAPRFVTVLQSPAMSERSPRVRVSKVVLWPTIPPSLVFARARYWLITSYLDTCSLKKLQKKRNEINSHHRDTSEFFAASIP